MDFSEGAGRAGVEGVDFLSEVEDGDFLSNDCDDGDFFSKYDGVGFESDGDDDNADDAGTASDDDDDDDDDDACVGDKSVGAGRAAGEADAATGESTVARVGVAGVFGPASDGGAPPGVAGGLDAMKPEDLC